MFVPLAPECSTKHIVVHQPFVTLFDRQPGSVQPVFTLKGCIAKLGI
jgi:hypothetical protein